ncbi:replication initiator protein A [Methylobacterium sp. J-030]|uniref:replication initiator protein A n=1 Tax=Methylobacterium sp. J-030 TaxID=2836627 RepID=UPI001FB90052|nr:replication initiator protein A [Methylobacterium sp. J-030]MCJ2072967.1 replication initiator protein A [Methylobacterium sp. J-030]
MNSTDAGADVQPASDANPSAPFLRDFTAFLKHPFLALGPRSRGDDQRGRGTEFEATLGGSCRGVSVEPLKPDRFGVATLADGDVLVYAASVLTQRLNAGQDLHPPITASPNEILRTLGKPTDGRHHTLLAASFERLATTNVRFALLRVRHSAGQHNHSPQNFAYAGPGFSLIEWWERPPRGSRAPWRFRLPTWLVSEIESKQILKIEPSLLQRRGLERRVAGWARAYLGQRSSWEIDIAQVYRLAGALTAPRQFRHELRALVARQPIHSVTLVFDPTQQKLRVTHENALIRASIDGPSLGTEHPAEGEPFDIPEEELRALLAHRT